MFGDGCEQAAPLPLHATDAEHACRVHAASVLHMMHMLMCAGLMEDGVLEGITMLACYLSAIGEMGVLLQSTLAKILFLEKLVFCCAVHDLGTYLHAELAPWDSMASSAN